MGTTPQIAIRGDSCGQFILRGFGYCGAPLLRARERSRCSAGNFIVSLLLCTGCEVTPGSIAGEVFNIGADGQRAVVPGALISLSGLVERQTESDAIGQYRFELLPPGRYTAEATAPGLKGAVPVDVAAGETAAAPISLELTAVTTSVTVTATDSAYPRSPRNPRKPRRSRKRPWRPPQIQTKKSKACCPSSQEWSDAQTGVSI